MQVCGTERSTGGLRARWRALDLLYQRPSRSRAHNPKDMSCLCITRCRAPTMETICELDCMLDLQTHQSQTLSVHSSLDRWASGKLVWSQVSDPVAQRKLGYLYPIGSWLRLMHTEPSHLLFERESVPKITSLVSNVSKFVLFFTMSRFILILPTIISSRLASFRRGRLKKGLATVNDSLGDGLSRTINVLNRCTRRFHAITWTQHVLSQSPHNA